MEPVKLHYFKGRGRAETTRWMLAVNQIEFVNIPIESPQALAALRASGKLPFDQMPLLEIEGLNLSQSSAMIRFLARRINLYGDNDADACWCDMIAATTADFAEGGMQAAFQSTADLAKAGMHARFDKFGLRFEARLAANGTGYCAGSRLSFADVVLAEALTEYLHWLPDLLAASPHLAALQQQVLKEPGIAAYLDSAQRYPIADADYVIGVARTLQRALPAHMPEPNRFIA